MDTCRRLEWAVVAVIGLALVASASPLASSAGAEADPTTVGDGNATVSVESFPVDRLAIDAGRFGTRVQYLRIPDVGVTVSRVDGHPRLVYRVQIPALDLDESATRVLDGDARGRVRVRGVDHALNGSLPADQRYDARVTLRVQSFEVDWTVVSRSVSVEVVE